MSQNHSATKRNRRQVSGKRGHPGQKTQHALRSFVAQMRDARQRSELRVSAEGLAREAQARKEARLAKRAGVSL